jgi:hypothetical protein
MLWDEDRPEFTVNTRADCCLEKKKKFLQLVRGKGNQGVEVSLALLNIRLSFMKFCNTNEHDSISRASSDHDRDPEESAD